MAKITELAEDEILKLEGRSKNSYKYLIRDYIFYKIADNYSSNETYVCSYSNNTRWKCRARVTRNKHNKLIITNEHHDHDNKKEHLKQIEMINALKEAAKFSGSPQEIYDRIASRHVKAAESISLQHAANIIYRARIQEWNIPQPASLEELSEFLKSHPFLKKYYQGCYHPSNHDDGTIIIFADDDVLNHLNNAKYLYFDGNFKVVPTEPESMQTWNILMKEHGTKNTEVTLVGFAWCTNANHGTYCEVLEFLKKRAPRMAESVECIFTDFEQVAILAFRLILPRVKIHGCLFHYSQAITNYWDGLPLVKKIIEGTVGKTRKAPKETLFVCRCLPLLPAEQINESILYVKKIISEHLEEWPALEIFYKYLVHQWQGKPELLSCFGNLTRTDNDSETFNRTLKTRLGVIGAKHPILRDFLYNMHNIICVESNNINKQVKVRRDTQKEHEYNKNLQISEAQKKLVEKELTVEEFLYECMTAANQEYIMKEREIRMNDGFKKETQKKELQKIDKVPEEIEPIYGVPKMNKRRKKNTDAV